MIESEFNPNAGDMTHPSVIHPSVPEPEPEPKSEEKKSEAAPPQKQGQPPQVPPVIAL